MKYITGVILIVIFLFYSCGDSDVTQSGNGGNIIDPTITITDQFGNMLGGDTTDWCYRGGSGVVFNPVYPNPTSDTMNLNFSISQEDTLTLYFVNSPGDTLFILNNAPVLPGFYHLAFYAHSAGYNNIIKRLYLKVKSHPNTSQYCRYYGDVQFY
jgi:hypothetical protein